MKNKLLLAILLFISFVAYRVWFFSNSLLTYGDWLFHFPESLVGYVNYPFSWSVTDFISFGNFNIVMFMYPFLFVWGILSYILSYPISERLIFLWPSIIVSVFGSYYLVKYVTKSKLAGFIGSILFTYNSYFIIGRTAHLTLMNAFAFSLPAILFFIKSLERKNYFFALLCGLTLFIESFYEVRATYITVFVLMSLFLFDVCFQKRFILLEFYKKISAFLIALLVLFLLNFYWLFGLLMSSDHAINYYIGYSLFGNNFLNILHAFTLHHPFWTGGKSAIFDLQPIPFYFFLYPLTAFLGLVLSNKNRYIYFFAYISLVGILLTKQSDVPFKLLYFWLYKNFPGFNVFREASKFFYLIALGYSVLVGQFCAEIWNRFKNRTLYRLIGGLIIALVMISILINIKPLLTGELGTMFKPKQIPDDYLLVKDFIRSQKGYFRTLWIPQMSRWGYYDNIHPKISYSEMVGNQWKSLTLNYPDLLKNKFSDNIFDLASIKYFIIPLQDKKNDDDFFGQIIKRKSLIAELDQSSYLNKLNIGTRDVVVYENINYKPHLYLTNEKEMIEKRIPYHSLTFSYLNLTHYNLTLLDIRRPVILNFSESFHPGWALRIGNFNLMDSILKKNYFVDYSFHFKNAAGFNSYYIDPNNLCQKFSCLKNPDGTYRIIITLYFKPQTYVYIGTMISGLSLLVIILIILYISFSKNIFSTFLNRRLLPK